ncbi:MAG: ABC transporter, partial [Nitrospinae bacterium]|nr:ABC transporter [Nitrospinota bacterium]
MRSIKSIAIATALCASVAAPAQAAEDFKVGLILPFSGVYGGLGGEIARAFELGLEVFGGEVNGRKIVLVKEDTEG